MKNSCSQYILKEKSINKEKLDINGMARIRKTSTLELIMKSTQDIEKTLKFYKYLQYFYNFTRIYNNYNNQLYIIKKR